MGPFRRAAGERGSALLSTVAVTAAALLGVAVLMDVFLIYAARQAGQTAAAAAALGARQALEQALAGTSLADGLTAAERGCRIRQAGARAAGAMQAAAAWFARQNRGSGAVTVTFPHARQMQVHVAVAVPVPLTVTARLAPWARPALVAEATAAVRTPARLAVDLAQPC